MLRHLKQKQKQIQEMRSDFYTSRGTHVYFKDDLTNDEIDVEEIIAQVESALPEHLLSELEMIVVGWFDEFEDRNINAFYKDGTLYISNIQDDEDDMYDDIIHEIAHSLESALDILLTEEQKQKRAIEYYSYIAELSKQNDDGTASIYKYEGSVHLSDGKSLHIKIDYGASAVEKLTKRKLEFVFLCD